MRTLLIADDERTIREGIASAVNWEVLGISRVLLSADGREAYETIKRERPDIAIVDIIMPEMTGLEVIARFDEEGGGPEFIIISGYGEFDYAREAIRHRVNNYILKPCDIEEISATISRIVAEMEYRRSLEEERLHLKEYIDSLVPQAQEEILRGFLTGDPPGRPELIAEVFGGSCSRFQLLLFCPADAGDYAKLPALKKCVDRARPERSRGAILHDCIALILEAEDEAWIKDLVSAVNEEAARSGIAGLKTVVSGQGALEDLPEMYQKAREALELFPQTGCCAEAGAETFIDVTTAQYSKAVRRIMRYVKENLADSSLSLSHIASHISYLNPDYLGRLFKKECGMRFSDYLMMIRMEKAKQILASTCELKMYEVARQVGLGDNAAYFGQVFRKYTGLLPTEYRARHAAGPGNITSCPGNPGKGKTDLPPFQYPR